jgi:hypothetical protein
LKQIQLYSSWQWIQIISASFSSWSIVYCPRECNRVARALAALGCKCPQGATQIWDGMPDGVEDLVASDLVEPVS